MKPRIPDLAASIGDVPRGAERERLQRAHEALLRAGPLPDLPASLRRPPAVNVRRLPVRPRARPRRRALLAAAAATLAFAAASGVQLATSRPAETVQRAVVMHATAAALHASATLRIGTRDEAGNSSLTLRVRGLPPLPSGSYYEMYVTDKGRPVGGCGTFRTDGGTTVIQLNVPYPLGEYSGWTIARRRPGRPPSPALLTT